MTRTKTSIMLDGKASMDIKFIEVEPQGVPLGPDGSVDPSRCDEQREGAKELIH